MLVVAWMIARIGVDLVRRSVMELIDTGLDPEQIERFPALWKNARLDPSGGADEPHL